MFSRSVPRSPCVIYVVYVPKIFRGIHDVYLCSLDADRATTRQGYLNYNFEARELGKPKRRALEFRLFYT